MQWIILIGDERFNLNQICNIQHSGENTTTSLTESRIVVDYGYDHIFYESAKEIMSDYEDEDIKKIPFQNPEFIMMTYTSEKLMKEILSQENFPRGIYIDDDKGSIIPIEDFILS